MRGSVDLYLGSDPAMLRQYFTDVRQVSTITASPVMNPAIDPTMQPMPSGYAPGHGRPGRSYGPSFDGFKLGAFEAGGDPA